MKYIPAALTLLAAIAVAGASQAEPIRVVAAETFYAEAARAVGGDRVTVEAIVAAPGIDPHDFEPPPSAARKVADAAIVILNGAGHDHWMDRLIAGTPTEDRIVINVAAISGHQPDDNPHIWYDPAVMPAATRALADAMIALDPDGAAVHEAGRDAFLAELQPIADAVARIRSTNAGRAVVATEPVFGPMAEALGLKMTNEDFQRAIMNDIEPAARDVATMVDDIRTWRASVLFYNAQVQDAFTRQIVEVANEAGVPVVAVTETEPDGMTFVPWMLGQLEATAEALATSSP